MCDALSSILWSRECPVEYLERQVVLFTVKEAAAPVWQHLYTLRLHAEGKENTITIFPSIPK
jgi:hypothetical protein